MQKVVSQITIYILDDGVSQITRNVLRNYTSVKLVEWRGRFTPNDYITDAIRLPILTYQHSSAGVSEVSR